MPYTIVVIDLQRKFTAACKKSVIQNSKHLLFQAMEDNADIVFLEYAGFGRTNSSLTNLCDDYHSTYYLRKGDCSGAEEIKSLKDGFKLQTQHFKICGVNTDQCVQHTVIDLSVLFPESVIEIIAPACGTVSLSRHKYALEVMGAYNNVIINNNL